MISSTFESELYFQSSSEIDVTTHNNFSQSSIDTPTIIERFVLTGTKSHEGKAMSYV
jgi:hypothetical protein